MSVVPDDTAVTMPFDATVATAMFDEFHAAVDVTVDVEPSASVASAVNCDDVPTVGGVPTTVTDLACGVGVPDGAVDELDELEHAYSAVINPASTVR